MSKPDLERPGVWARLFPRALKLMSHLEREVPSAHWTFGGGTVLMLRLSHRRSKDIDLFVPDPQYLGYVNPRLSDVAEDISTDYEEAAELIKLFLPEGEIDVIVGTPLTDAPYDAIDYRGRTIRVETSAEIIAKKMWHRGDRAKGRDLFDLCAVAGRTGTVAGGRTFLGAAWRCVLGSTLGPQGRAQARVRGNRCHRRCDGFR